ncbi:DUF4040 domain-containing protein [Gammaproteobacteria bacterium]|nr:DUF4040 domain-containing protein [Gammaproteobacteria bacterium]
MEPIDWVVQGLLLLMLLMAAGATIVLRNLFAVVMMLGVYSLICASLFMTLDAVDVAFTEAAVGAGVSTIFFLGSLLVVGRDIRTDAAKLKIGPLLISGGCAALMIYASGDLPAFGDPQAMPNQHLVPRFLEQSGEEVGPPNIVTSVLASYRGYDTMGEVGVVFTAAVGVLLLLGSGSMVKVRRRRQSLKLQTQRWQPKANPVIRVESSLKANVLIRECTDLLVAPMLIFALYVQWHGDYGPGGGFQAGVIFAVGVISYALIYGLDRTQKKFPPLAMKRLMVGGWLLYIGTGLVSMLFGANFLDYSPLGPTALAGQHYGILAIELGVGITVATVMIALFYAFASRDRGE